MLAVDRFAQELVEQFELGGWFGFFEADQAEIATDLTQSEETGQHLHAFGSGICLCGRSAKSALDLAQKRVVGAALTARQAAWDDLFDFLGQVFGDVAFPASKQERLETAGEPSLDIGRGAARQG